jgi:hypothetical protein
MKIGHSKMSNFQKLDKGLKNIIKNTFRALWFKK